MGYSGEAGLLWLAPIKVQGCGALATTVMMLTWLTALMRCLQSGCHVASTTIIIATGKCTWLSHLSRSLHGFMHLIEAASLAQ